MKSKTTCLVLCLIVVYGGVGFGQSRSETQQRENSKRQEGSLRRSLPSVSELIEKFDKNHDDNLSINEITDERFRRNFKRWDSDEDA